MIEDGHLGFVATFLRGVEDQLFVGRHTLTIETPFHDPFAFQLFSRQIADVQFTFDGFRRLLVFTNDDNTISMVNTEVLDISVRPLNSLEERHMHG